MRRREFLSLVGCGMLASPVVTHAQQRTIPLVGFLSTVVADGYEGRVRAFRQGLKDAGYAEGENVAVAYRWAENKLDQLPILGADLVQRNAAVIVATGGTAGALAAKALNTPIPIVFGIPEDPVKLGLVKSLGRPGGTMTGVNFFVGEILGKRLELLRELVPTASRLAVFVNPANAARAATQTEELQAAARAMGVETRIFQTSNTAEINDAFAAIGRERYDALFVSADPIFVTRRVQIANLAARHALPTSFPVRDGVEAGGLMSYGTNISDAYRQIGTYTGLILKGANPADLPILQSTKFELVINTQTAAMLGISVPATLLARADEVIE